MLPLADCAWSTYGIRYQQAASQALISKVIADHFTNSIATVPALKVQRDPSSCCYHIESGAVVYPAVPSDALLQLPPSFVTDYMSSAFKDRDLACRNTVLSASPKLVSVHNKIWYHLLSRLPGVDSLPLCGPECLISVINLMMGSGDSSRANRTQDAVSAVMETYLGLSRDAAVINEISGIIQAEFGLPSGAAPSPINLCSCPIFDA